MNKLAIVIPAYKEAFFEKTLQSIAKQTCKKFTLYIGNDGSGEKIANIVEKYYNEIKIKYHEFENNIGKENLILHWNRCIELVKEEEWIWMFSDDDLMENNCVEMFYNTLEKYPDEDLFHFDVLQIDEKEKILRKKGEFPEKMSVEEFILRRLNGEIDSFIVDYVFRKSTFFKNNGFQYFDLAWGSDDATWIKIGRENGIRTIINAKVYWRYSSHNISQKKGEYNIIRRKVIAYKEFMEWLFNYVEKNGIHIDLFELRKKLRRKYISQVKYYMQYVPYLELVFFAREGMPSFLHNNTFDILKLYLLKIKKEIFK